jgi:hypothetical protein
MDKLRVLASFAPVTLAASRRDLVAATRRRLLAALTVGLFAGQPFSLDLDEVEAKKKGKHRGHNRKHKRKRQQAPISPPPPPGPNTNVDATCPGPNDSGLGSTDGNTRLAQTFTALASGALVSAQLPLVKQAGTDGEYLLRLSAVDDSGIPTNDVLAETSVSNLSVPIGPSIVTFTFANPAAVTTGTQYALVLTRPGSTHLQWDGHLGDTCAGRGFVSTDQSAPFEEGIEGLDLIFTTFVSS